MMVPGIWRKLEECPEFGVGAREGTQIKMKSSFHHMKDQPHNQVKRKKLSGEICPGLPEAILVLAWKFPYPGKPLSLG